MTYHQPFQVVGFHSCDKTVGLKVLNGEMDLNPSKNSWDWLGSGVYFWEQNPGRALEYAKECAAGRQKNKTPIVTPFVLGAVIELGNCLNLLDSSAPVFISKAYGVLNVTLSNLNKDLPVNKGARRELDCAVIQTVHELTAEDGKPAFDTVRCAFPEGGEIYKGSNFTDRLHTEICVINKEMIKGYFLPRPIDMFNPNLKAAA